MYLAPTTLSGRNVCPFASEGCAAACLNTAGHGAFSNVQRARVAKTQWFYSDRASFKAQLFDDIRAHIRKAKRLGLRPAVRLNGTSDLTWEHIWPDLFTTFSEVQFYDYTKFPFRIRDTRKLPVNYDLTFSRSEANDVDVWANLVNGRRVAMVFDTPKGQPLPDWFMGYAVVDGDAHDMRFLDPQSVIVGLRAKGKGKQDTSGFVISA